MNIDSVVRSQPPYHSLFNDYGGTTFTLHNVISLVSINTIQPYGLGIWGKYKNDRIRGDFSGKLVIITIILISSILGLRQKYTLYLTLKIYS